MVRPWVTPKEVKEYSTSAKVQSRSELQLGFDIARAEKYVIYHTRNNFTADEYKNEIPKDVKMCVILLAEAYAIKSANQSNGGAMKSEQFDDYSYTIDTDADLVDTLQLGPMLEPFIVKDAGNVVMKLRKL